MSNASGKQRRKSAGKRVVKTFDNTPDEEFERDAAEIFARQVENYKLAQEQIKQQESKAIKALGNYEKARKLRRNIDKSVGEVIRKIEDYEATRQQLGGIEKPSEDAIKEALSLHVVPQVIASQTRKKQSESNADKASRAARKKRAKKSGRGNYAKAAKKHAEAQGRRAEHSYRGNFRKLLTHLDDADRNFRTAVELLEGAENDRALERLVNAVESWVERLRVLFAEPPESCRESALKIVRERPTFPINFAGRTKYATPSFTWLDEFGFQKDCVVGVPREKGNVHYELFRQFAYFLFQQIALLRAELELGAMLNTRKPSGAFERMVAKLPSKPDESWHGCFKAAPAAFYGEDWALEIPQLESFRRSFDGLVIPLHSSQAIRKWPADNIRLHQKSHRDPAMATNAEHLLKDFAKILFKPKKRGTRSGGSPS